MTVADSAQEALRIFARQNPGHLPEGLLCAGNCAELGPILRGEKDAVQVLFSGAGAELLDQFYGDGLSRATGWRRSARRCRRQRAICPKAADCASWKLAPAPAGLASQVLPLLERGLHTYTFTDVSAGFFPAARQKLAAFPEVEFKTFDLEKPGVEQEFAAGSFDFIIGTNVLHAVSDIRATLWSSARTARAGRQPLFMDMATPQFGPRRFSVSRSGWWHFTDRDLRPEQPLLERAQWETCWHKSGFDETLRCRGLIGPGWRRPDRIVGAEGLAPTVAAIRDGDSPREKSWLIFADASGLGDSARRTAACRRRAMPSRTTGGTICRHRKRRFTLRVEARKIGCSCS